MPDVPASQPQRWTRDYLFDILRMLEIGYIFGVPGTNEIPIIDGTETAENKGKVRYIECLHENIALGAAMGYARMTGRPGVVEVHVTPGIGHCIGNLSNAWKSHVPLVVLCGQQQNELVTQEPLLASDVVQIAKQFTKWSHELRAWEEIPLVLQRAFKEAMAPPMGPVFISLPWDFTIRKIGPDERVRGVTRIPQRFTGDSDAVAHAAQLLAGAKNPVIIAGDAVGYADAWKEVQELALRLGAPVYLEGFSSLANFPNNDYHWQGELPGDQQQTQQRLLPHDVAFLCGFGAQAQLAVYKYSDGPLIPTSVRQIALANNTWDLGKNAFAESAILGDIKATLPGLNALLAQNPPPGADARNQQLQAASEARMAAWRQYAAQAQQAEHIWGVLVADSLRELLVTKNLQKRFVYVHEAVSDAASFQMMLPLGEGEAPTSYYCTQGGSLGWSMPASLGIKLAGPGTQGVEPELVINAVGDGSCLFYPQVWWTAAHRKLPILYLIMNNREYHTLQAGLQQVVTAYGDAPGFGWKPVTMTPEYLTLRNPEFSFVDVAKSFGVPNGQVIHRPDQVKAALKIAVEHVLTRHESYVLDIRTAQVTPPPPAGAAGKGLQATAAPVAPPPLDFWFHQQHPQRVDDGDSPLPRGAQVVF
ncbi:thiamine pyrophosphate-binding protein [Myxococcus qinghaiensis]|uniref:thiamine pyrophosphate-binding protein n=1 Tax=Myxococcus qinghaiensis TaxID=2906758 RepID=UPI0020A6EA06|nr:thiamine pyrophosphate-binding protein [Myxococcus qinghaiensis]MCP3166892.1 thiamine pyrophosphate-binding protein [Myxococcus qinghaiensis]